MESWVATCGPIDFDEPAKLWFEGEPAGAEPSHSWHAEGLTLAEAIREALTCELGRRDALRVKSPSFAEPLDFDHVRALHGHPDYPGRTPHPAPSHRRTTRIVVEIEAADDDS